MTDQDLALVAGGLGIAFLFISLLTTVIFIIPLWKIYTKTGQSGALSLLWLVPIVNLVMLYMLAFGNWPVLQELEQYRNYYRNQGTPQQ